MDKNNWVVTLAATVTLINLVIGSVVVYEVRAGTRELDVLQINLQTDKLKLTDLPDCSQNPTTVPFVLPQDISGYSSLSRIVCGHDILKWSDLVSPPRAFRIQFNEPDCTGDTVAHSANGSSAPTVSIPTKSPAASYFLACKYTLTVNPGSSGTFTYDPHIIIMK